MNKSLAWHIDQNGVVIGPSIHDGHLVALRYNENGEAEIEIESVSKEKIIIQVRGITDIGIHILSRRAICFELLMWKLGDSPEVSRNIPDNPWTLIFSNSEHVDLSAERLRLIKKFATHHLVQLSCSYGGDVVLICESVDISVL